MLLTRRRRNSATEIAMSGTKKLQTKKDALMMSQISQKWRVLIVVVVAAHAHRRLRMRRPQFPPLRELSVV